MYIVFYNRDSSPQIKHDSTYTFFLSQRYYLTDPKVAKNKSIQQKSS